MKIDLIILALVAVFILLRLRSVLGQRTGTEKDHYNLLENAPQDLVLDHEEGTGKEAGLKRIKLVDPGFSEDQFLGGAKKAYEQIIVAFHKGDVETLKPLLSPSVYKDFASEVPAHEDFVPRPTVHIEHAEIVGAQLSGYTAYVTVEFGAKVLGIENPADVQKETWTFSRNTRSQNPNWLLVSTTTDI